MSCQDKSKTYKNNVKRIDNITSQKIKGLIKFYIEGCKPCYGGKIAAITNLDAVLRDVDALVKHVTFNSVKSINELNAITDQKQLFAIDRAVNLFIKQQVLKGMNNPIKLLAEVGNSEDVKTFARFAKSVLLPNTVKNAAYKYLNFWQFPLNLMGFGKGYRKSGEENILDRIANFDIFGSYENQAMQHSEVSKLFVKLKEMDVFTEGYKVYSTKLEELFDETSKIPQLFDNKFTQDKIEVAIRYFDGKQPPKNPAELTESISNFFNDMKKRGVAFPKLDDDTKQQVYEAFLGLQESINRINYGDNLIKFFNSAPKGSYTLKELDEKGLIINNTILGYIANLRKDLNRMADISNGRDLKGVSGLLKALDEFKIRRNYIPQSGNDIANDEGNNLGSSSEFYLFKNMLKQRSESGTDTSSALKLFNSNLQGIASWKLASEYIYSQSVKAILKRDYKFFLDKPIVRDALRKQISNIEYAHFMKKKELTTTGKIVKDLSSFVGTYATLLLGLPSGIVNRLAGEFMLPIAYTHGIDYKEVQKMFNGALSIDDTDSNMVASYVKEMYGRYYSGAGIADTFHETIDTDEGKMPFSRKVSKELSNIFMKSADYFAEGGMLKHLPVFIPEIMSLKKGQEVLQSNMQGILFSDAYSQFKLWKQGEGKGKDITEQKAMLETIFRDVSVEGNEIIDNILGYYGGANRPLIEYYLKEGADTTAKILFAGGLKLWSLFRHVTTSNVNALIQAGVDSYLKCTGGVPILHQDTNKFMQIRSAMPLFGVMAIMLYQWLLDIDELKLNIKPLLKLDYGEKIEKDLLALSTSMMVLANGFNEKAVPEGAWNTTKNYLMSNIFGTLPGTGFAFRSQLEQQLFDEEGFDLTSYIANGISDKFNLGNTIMKGFELKTSDQYYKWQRKTKEELGTLDNIFYARFLRQLGNIGFAPNYETKSESVGNLLQYMFNLEFYYKDKKNMFEKTYNSFGGN